MFSIIDHLYSTILPDLVTIDLLVLSVSIKVHLVFWLCFQLADKSLYTRVEVQGVDLTITTNHICALKIENRLPNPLHSHQNRVQKLYGKVELNVMYFMYNKQRG